MSDVTCNCPDPACLAAFKAKPGSPAACPECDLVATARSRAIWQTLDAREREHHDGANHAAFEVDPAHPTYERAEDRPHPTGLSDDRVVVLDDIRSSWNVGAILRTADGCGFGGAYICGISNVPASPRVARVSLGAERSVRWRYRARVLTAIRELKTAGYRLVALEQTNDAIPLDAIRGAGPIALVVGNEVSGVSREALSEVDQTMVLPMQGHKQSFNVAVAFGIAAYGLARD